MKCFFMGLCAVLLIASFVWGQRGPDERAASSVWVTGTTGTLTTDGTNNFFPVQGNSAVNTAETARQGLVAMAGRATMIMCTLSGTTGAGKQYTITLRKNNADTPLSFLITGTSQLTGLSVGSVPFSAGDLVSINAVAAGTPSARTVWCGVIFRPF